MLCFARRFRRFWERIGVPSLRRNHLFLDNSCFKRIEARRASYFDRSQEEYVVVNAQNLARLCYETIRCAEEVHREARNCAFDMATCYRFCAVVPCCVLRQHTATAFF